MPEAMSPDSKRATATYEELADLEKEFETTETEIIRQQYLLTKPLYTKRASLISKIDNFWPLTLELAPPEIDQYIQPSDSEVLAESLTSIKVSRFEIDEDEKSGNPRSFSIKFEFKQNKWFSDTVLEKKFFYRQSKMGPTLVSEPVKIDWKKGQDLTSGLIDGAVDLWKKAKESKSLEKLPEYKKLAKLLEEHDRASLSFFTLFAYVSENSYVSEEESKANLRAEKERKGNQESEEEVDASLEGSMEAAEKWQEVEVCPHGSDLAMVIADDLWPNAIKYFVESNTAQDDEDIDMDEDEDDSDEDEDEPVDIRALVQGSKRKNGADSPASGKKPSKAMKKE